MSMDTDITYAPSPANPPAKATATAGAASGAVQIRPAAPAGTSNTTAFVILKASSSAAGPGFHVTFGDSTLAAPTAADMCLQDADGWVRLQLGPLVTHFRIFAESTSAGSVYALLVRP